MSNTHPLNNYSLFCLVLKSACFSVMSWQKVMIQTKITVKWRLFAPFILSYLLINGLFGTISSRFCHLEGVSFFFLNYFTAGKIVHHIINCVGPFSRAGFLIPHGYRSRCYVISVFGYRHVLLQITSITCHIFFQTRTDLSGVRLLEKRID